MSRPVEHRYFFATMPPSLVAHQVRAWAECKLGPSGLQEAGRLHVTLAITPAFPLPQPALAAALMRAGSKVRSPPFDLTLDRLSESPKSAALRPARAIRDLTALHRAIAQAVREGRIALRPDWRFSPHMTLAYRAGTAGAQAAPPVSWPVREFVLVHSYVNQNRHEILGRWPLEPAPEAQLSLFAA